MMMMPYPNKTMQLEEACTTGLTIYQVKIDQVTLYFRSQVVVFFMLELSLA